ncbi:hypothetical protein ABIB90_007193 [Bradyrhizobium sp. JR4.1]|nr:hypothetical protein [Bradyrhizobium sp. WSM1417]
MQALAVAIGVILVLGMSVVDTIHHAEQAYFDAAIMLLTFVLVGRGLEQNMRRRPRAVTGNLAALKAETAAKFVGPCTSVVAAADAKWSRPLPQRNGDSHRRREYFSSPVDWQLESALPLVLRH